MSNTDTLQLVAWFFSTIEFVLGLYILFLNPYHTANRHMSALLILFALNNLGVGILIGAIDLAQAAWGMYLLAATTAAIQPGLLLVSVVLLKPEWLYGRWRWAWYVVYFLFWLPIVLTVVDVIFRTQFWYTPLDAQAYQGGFVSSSNFSQGSLSSIIRIVDIYMMSLLPLIIPIVYVSFFDKKVSRVTRRLAWILLATQLLAIVFSFVLMPLVGSVLTTIAIGLVLIIGYSYATFQQMISERRAQQGRLQYRLTGLIVAITIPMFIATAAIVNYTTSISLVWTVIGLSTLTLLVLTFLAVRQAFLPIRSLTDTAQAITAGDLSRVAPIESEDEIGDLARAFNTMTDRLRDLLRREEARAAELEQEVSERKLAEAALKKLNQELDQRVEERTAELAQANEEIQALNERLKAENLRMTAELDVTRRLQQMLLPSGKELQQVEGVDIAGYMEPADEVGGDYYDVLQHNGQVKIGIGDVTGHGLESGVLMLMVQTAVRTLMTNGEQDPVRFLDVLNRTLHDNLQRMAVDKSLTLMLLDYETGRMRISGQHEQLIVVRQGGQIELKDTLDLGMPLGLVVGIGKFVGELSVDLQPGDGVVLYSDGFTEAESEAGEFYGLERLCTVVSKHWNQPAEEIKQAVVADVRQFIGQQTVYDDLTLLVIKQR